jgi:hypothetical protein
MTTDVALPIDAHVVALDETDHYNIAPADRPLIAKIRGVYLFNSNERTHCCEFTPSYYLIHLYDQVFLTEDGDALDESAKDEIYQRYEHEGGDNIYVHCHTIDALVEKMGPGDHHHHGATGVDYDKSDYDEQLEGLVEHFHCNCVI